MSRDLRAQRVGYSARWVHKMLPSEDEKPVSKEVLAGLTAGAARQSLKNGAPDIFRDDPARFAAYILSNWSAIRRYLRKEKGVRIVHVGLGGVRLGTREDVERDLAAAAKALETATRNYDEQAKLSGSPEWALRGDMPIS